LIFDLDRNRKREKKHFFWIKRKEHFLFPKIVQKSFGIPFASDTKANKKLVATFFNTHLAQDEVRTRHFLEKAEKVNCEDIDKKIEWPFSTNLL
jgi:hypothetical protein